MSYHNRKRRTSARRIRRRRGRIGALICFVLAVVLFIVLAVGFYGGSIQDDRFQKDVSKDAQQAQSSQLHAAKSAGQSSIPVTASKGILICSDTNEILWEKGSQMSTAPASCAKLLSALTVLKFCDAEETLRVGREVYRIPEDASRAYLSIGAQMSVRQALIAMLLPSGNDAAYALAVYTGRKIASDEDLSIDEALERFEDEMNDVARELGALDSKFISPDGYDADGQYTTAYDLALIGQAALENELISEIAGMVYSSETWLSGETAEYENTNEMLLSQSPYYIPECTGLKTGTSTSAGACLVMSFTVHDKHYIGVIMGSTEDMRFEDAMQLYKFLINN